MSESPQGNGSTAVQGPSGDDRPQLEYQPRGPEAFARSGQEPPTDKNQGKPPFYKRPLVLIIGGVVLVAAVVVGLLWYLNARHWESTDDAFVEADVTQVSPRVSGYVLRVLITDNQSVKQGEALVELDPKDLQARYNESAAAVTAAQSNVQQAREMLTVSQADVGQAQASEQAARTEAERANTELERYNKLPAAAVTQQQITNLQAAARQAQANLEAARKRTASTQAHVQYAQSQIAAAQAQVEQARAAGEQNKLQLSYTHIIAPVDGTVTNRSVNPGDYVQAGQALFALVPPQVYAIANYKETQLELMKPGQDVELTIDAYPGHTFHGKVDSIQRGSGAAFSLLPPENATGNYVKVVQRVPVKIVFDPEGFHVGPGMSVTPRVRVR